MRHMLPAAALLLLAACWGEEEPLPDDTPRAVRTIVVAAEDPVRVRHFPAILEPPEITRLAFDVTGRLGPLGLRIGQEVSEGEVLAQVEAVDASLRLEQARAAVTEAEAGLANAADTANRQRTLAERGVASEAARDSAVTAERQAQARLEQAEKNLNLLEESLADTSLKAPFDGIVNTIEVDAFGNVAAGQPVVTIYPDTGLQATILVSYDVVSQLSLGDPVSVLPTDGPDAPLEATITEIARRAPAVSSFPVVVTLEDTRPDLRSGMAVGVSLPLPLPEAADGLPIPISALALNRSAKLDDLTRTADVFVFTEGDGEAPGTVTPRTVGISAVVEDKVFVTDGLSEGERVVTAGVSFLRADQPVTLWEESP
ncbi:efflux RND transporter periplasmic adaptor subunit [Sulfitobacter sp. D35]|uniref:efflux RND transporter periplasmic adaptor subunit n=1 Tax=Sulfitobacter sp. D35 TaxID=3083252 RepID=UPI00296F4568|nr:efflux RND transporter periplasmic adaptor subunit [Sulfitobacter sp. D35]MDW4499343.1 efflux RND transporter periplasmic adaptor subunit [Sulfitobacter sp. D35]